MDWKNILKAPTESEIHYLYGEVMKRTGILVALNNFDLGDEDDTKSIAYSLRGIKENILDDEDINTKHFLRLLDANVVFNNDAHLNRLVMELEKKLQWRIDNS
tara:strand:- start:857 stop:1165 length:309 start_codon:yes stop_codon:yes gene_type:complete